MLVNFQLPFRDSEGGGAYVCSSDFILSTPFSGFRRFVQALRAITGKLSTPFSGFLTLAAAIGGRGHIFQLPFRDSRRPEGHAEGLRAFNSLFGILYTRLPKVDSTKAFNSLFGISRNLGHASGLSSLLSTPFSGLVYGHGLEGFEEEHRFQLPFRDSGVTNIESIYDVPAFNSLFGILGERNWIFQKRRAFNSLFGIRIPNSFFNIKSPLGWVQFLTRVRCTPTRARVYKRQRR